MKFADVRKQYLKAAAIVHPDKIQKSKDPDRNYIANRCFAALSEAFDLYKVTLPINIFRKKKGFEVFFEN